MSGKLKVYIKNIDAYVDIQGGETLQEIFEAHKEDIGFTPICAQVNNKTENLTFPVFTPKQIDFKDIASAVGQRVYTRSLCMMLYRALTDVMPEAGLRIEHSISRGLYCRLFKKPGEKEAIGVTPDLIAKIQARMREIADADMEFVRKERLTKDVVEMFRSQDLDEKALLLETTHELYTVFYRLGDLSDSYYGPLASRTGMISVFDLVPYHEGFLLMGPSAEDPAVPAVPLPQEKMYVAFTDYLRFNKIIGVSDVGELNRAVQTRRTSQLINVAEALHDKLLGRISDRIAAINAEGGARIVLIAGPSSSGKTTSTKRLAIQLMTNLIVPKMISLDDYFVDRDHTPRDVDGDYDYENLHALDLDRLNSDLSDLLAGRQINLPTYSFELGRRIEREKPLKLEANDVLLIEGIHGLNPELVAGIPQRDLFKIYVSALTTLSIDAHNWISTTDNRLLRRIVRDNKYRHTSALDTIRRWPSVRRGEEKWIFPFQENADAMFNSSLLFEIGVMKDYAMPLLRDVPHDLPEYSEAYRLMKLLSYFESIPADQIPTTSLLREFLGGSSFHY